MVCRRPAATGAVRVTRMSEERGQQEQAHRTRRRAFVDARLLYRDSADPGLPEAHGLYDPALDKDSCGVGFIADIKGRKSHQIVEDALDHPGQPRASRRGRRRPARRRRRRHPGADPAQVLRPQGRASSASRCRSPANTRVGALFMPRDAERREIIRKTSMRAGRGARRPDAARLARRADRQLDARRDGEADRAVPHAGVHRTRQTKLRPRTSSSAGSTSCARSISDDDLSPARAAAVGLLPGVDLVPHGHLQGHVPRRPARHLLSRPARAGLRERARAGASALLDQHVPDLVAGASLPHGRAQRRDQHAARQRQLDGGAAGVGRRRSSTATTSRSSGRSPTRASPTPPASTTRSNSWCRAATRSRTR